MTGRCKVIIIGDPYVGKSSLFHRILFREFRESTPELFQSGMPDCFEKTFDVLGEPIRVELHDTPKNIRFLTNMGKLYNFYRSSDAVLLVYDVNDMMTFANLDLWVKECQEYIWGNSGHQLVWAVVGNKSDFLSEVSLDAVEEFMKEINASIFFEVSAKTGEKVDEMFLKIIEEVHERKLRTTCINKDNQIKLDSAANVTVSNNKMEKKCCA